MSAADDEGLFRRVHAEMLVDDEGVRCEGILKGAFPPGQREYHRRRAVAPGSMGRSGDV